MATAVPSDDYEPTQDEIDAMREADEANDAPESDFHMTTSAGEYIVEPNWSFTSQPNRIIWGGDTAFGTPINVIPAQAAQPENRSIFVAYPYSFARDDYRRVFQEVGEEQDVQFTYADEKITNVHILQKIEEMMFEAALSLFDVTTWNPNVALELGIAYARRWDFYVLFNPTIAGEEVLADLRGIDRVTYNSYAELGVQLRRIVEEQFGSPEPEPDSEGILAGLENVQKRIPDVVRGNPGTLIGGIASEIGLPVELTQSLVRPLLDTELETRGVRRGTRYYLHGEAPPENDEREEELGQGAA